MNSLTAMCMAKAECTIDNRTCRSDDQMIGGSEYVKTRGRVLALGSFFFGALAALSAQDSSAFKLSGYGEVYFGYDLSRPENGERPEFLYNHKRHNEFNANLLLLRGEYDRDGVRGGIGLMAGNYAQYNLAHEPEVMRHVYEARVGLRLAKERELWIDAGIFPSHIGFEGVIGMDLMTLTRSIVAENSPYYEAGAMLSYKPGRILFALLALNGWQRIQREPGNQRPAFGTQVRFDNNEGTVINWSTFVGSMGPDSTGAWRFYNNFYAQSEGDNHGMVLGVDVGVQEGRRGVVNTGDASGWFTVVGIYRQRISGRWWGSGRMEYFLDDMGVVLDRSGAMLGLSLGIDLRIGDRASWRMEGRLLGSAADHFVDRAGVPAQTNTALTTALAIRF